MNMTAELVQRMKAAALNATGAHERLSVMSEGDLFDISLVEGTQLDADITALNSFHDEATPANVLALVEALEARVKQIAEDVQIKARLCRESNSLFDRLRDAEQRIAEPDCFKVAFTEWLDKTEWVQTDKRFDVVKPWGKHRAEVLKLYIEHLEEKLETAEKLQDSAFRHGLQHGFSLGQTDNQAGFEQCMTAYSQKEKNNG